MTRTDGLRGLADRRKPKEAKVWTPPVVEDFAEGFVLAFDPSLSATGFVWLSHIVTPLGHRLEVRDGEVRGAEPPGGVGGKIAEVMRAQELYRSFRDLLAGFHPIREEVVVVHEAPPTGGGLIRNAESALLASLALRIAADELGFTLAPVVAVSAHRKLVCGRGDVPKKDAHLALGGWAPDVVSGYREHVTNEAKRDALCVGLSHLHRERR